ncbi:hypothetical protein D9M71_128210 [compost metagenome]
MTTGRLRWVCGHGNDSGVQAAEEGGYVIRSAGKQQDGAVSKSRTRLQGAGNGPRTQVQLPVGQHRLLLRVIGQKAQGNPLRGLRSTLCQCLDQRNREFEGVHHGGSCQSLYVKSGLGWRAGRASRHRGASCQSRGCTERNGWAGEIIKARGQRQAGRKKVEFEAGHKAQA